MNYTENYHLPQWVKSDRIMMEDFNAAMANIAEGMADNRDTSKSRSEAAIANAESRAFDRICRLAYNHYCFAQTITPFPRQIGIFHQVPAEDNTGIAGFTLFDGRYGLNNCPAYGPEALFATFQHLEPMETVQYGKRQSMNMQFTPPGNGYLVNVPLRITHDSSQPYKYDCSLKFEDLSTGEELAAAELPMNVPGQPGVMNYTYTFPKPVLLHRSHRYRLSVFPIYNTTNSTGYAVNNGLQVNCMPTVGAGSAEHTFQNPDENLGVLVVASYLSYENLNDPKLEWNGEEIPPWWTRAVPEGTGWTIREAVFRINTPVEDGDTAKLLFSTQSGSEVILHSWGAVLL